MRWIYCLFDVRWRQEFKYARSRRMSVRSAARIAADARRAAKL